MEPTRQSSRLQPSSDTSGGDRIETEFPHPQTPRDPDWILLGPQGLRAGWSALFFIALYYLLTPIFDTIAVIIDPALADPIFSPSRVLVTELIPFAILLIAGLIMARIEHRRLVEYNLLDARRIGHFCGGLGAGFAALSLLIAALGLGGWLHFGRLTLTAAQALEYGSLWAFAFLLVGFFEEGAFRCYLQFTLARGISFWWALAAIGGLCLLLQFSGDPKGSAGVYAVAFLGLIPCWLLHRARRSSSGFWQAAWTTSTAFGYYHTNNNGENWIGIFAAAFIGFVFCVSVRVTGSAWWAIGCHSAWDWAETYFYGTADSGFPAQRHLLSTSTAGNILWSGGTDGPEGSLLVLPVILLLLIFLMLAYRRRYPVVE
jgi:uncharacterized protein